ncbi:MAG TPA: TonB-dependent receptor [Candidatus Angelobacter sp.]|nr:TonB-dependent receptor [Candidatus Angelobacter sp.]
MFTLRKLPSLALLILLLVISSLCVAQTSKGVIAGTVHDSTGAVMPSATVTVTNTLTGETRSTTTNEVGTYRIEAVDPGVYTIKISAANFKTTSVEKVDVKGSIITSVNATLEIGTATETVEVTAKSIAVETENGQLAHSISTVEVQEIPVFNLNAISLVLTQPGVLDVGANSFSNGMGFSVNGARPRANNFLLDGQDNNDNSIEGQALQPNNLQAVQEVAVLTNSYSAEFGRGGGSVTNLISKSGTNQFHGSLWELYAGSGLNAIPAEAGLGGETQATKPRFDTHTFGFTAGGPIWKNKLFGFGSSEWVKFYGKAAPAAIRVPTDAGFAALDAAGTANAHLLEQYFGSLRGDPAQSARTVDIGVRPGCPAASLSPTGTCLVETGLLLRPAPAQQAPNTQWTVKIDFTPRAADSISGRYIRNTNSLSPDFFNFPTSLPGLDPQQGGTAENMGFTWTHVLSDHAVNEFRTSYGHFDFQFGPTAEAASNPLFALPTINTIAGTSFPTLGINAALPQGRGHVTYQFQDAYTLTLGRNTWKVGGDVARLIVKDEVPFNARGTLTFGSGGGFSGLGNFIDNFTGASSGAALTFGNPTIRPIMMQEAFYIEDTFHMKSNLTLDLGLRYEFNNNPANTLPFPAVNVATEPSSTFPQVVHAREDGNNWGPRVGFAYTPHLFEGLFGRDKTVLRGGFGIFYDTIFTNILDNEAAGAPNAVSGTLLGAPGTRGLADATGLVSTVSPQLNPRSAVSTIDSNLRNPQTYQWNFNVQRELPWNMSFNAAYVGNRGLRLFANDELNPGINGVRENPVRGPITVRDNSGDSIYHGLDLKLDRRFSKGLLLRGAYTYSKLIDTVSEVFSFASPAGNATSFPQQELLGVGGRAAERGLSTFNRAQRFVFSYVWDVPGVNNTSNGLFTALGYITKGWQIAGTSAFQTGAPANITSGFDQNGDLRATNDRPSIGNPSAPLASWGVDGRFVGGTPGTLYDGPAFEATGALNPISANSVHFVVLPGIGNLGRNTFVMPGAMEHNMAVTRRFKLRGLENQFLEVRAEAFNVFNHPNLGLGDAISGTPQTDTVLADGAAFLDNSQTIYGGRQLRLQVKWSF